MVTRIRIAGYQFGELQQVEFIKMVSWHLGVDFGAAKHILESVIDNRAPLLAFPTEQACAAFASIAPGLGISISLEDASEH